MNIIFYHFKPELGVNPHKDNPCNHTSNYLPWNTLDLILSSYMHILSLSSSFKKLITICVYNTFGQTDSRGDS